MRKGNTFIGACYKGAQYIGELYKGSTHINSFGFPKTASGASPITLANARAKLLTLNKLTGNAQRTIEIDGAEYSVPSGITLLEYIESSGTQYIDTGIQANPSCTNTTMRVCLTDTTGTTGLFGARGSTSASARSYNIFGNVSGAAGRFDNVNPSNPYVFTENTWYEIELGHNGLKGTVTVDGTLVSTGGNNMENSEVGSIYIGSFYNNGTPFATKTPAKWGIVQIWKDGANISGIFHPAKNASNVVGMYDFVSGRFFTNAGTGTFTAGAELPTPSANLGVAGTGDRTDNLFNPDNADTRYPNGWYSSGGTIENFINNRTITIPCSEGDVFTFKHYTQASGARYFWIYSDTVASGEPCSAMYGTIISTNTITTTAAPSNAKYIGICFWRINGGTVQSAADDFVVVKGSTEPTAYIPYGYRIDERIARNCGCIDMGTLNWNPIGNGCLYSAITGKANGRNIYCSKYPTDQSSMASATSNMHIGGHDGNRVYFKNTSLENTRAAAQADLSGVYLYYKRTTDSEWTAPTMHTAYASAPLRKVGSYADTLDYASGTITRRVGVKVLDGTESWSLQQGSGYYRYGASIVQDAITPTTNIICTHGTGGTNRRQWRIAAGILMRYDTASSPDFANVDDFKSWLAAQYAAGTPVTIYYPLATATTESITPIPVTPSIGTNYLESANEVAASNIEASYISKTS